MTALGFELLPGEHPIIALMLRDPRLAQNFADALRERGVLATAFSFPVVPRGEDRIRIQMSAAHDLHILDEAIAAFADVGRDLRVIGQRDTEGGAGVFS